MWLSFGAGSLPSAVGVAIGMEEQVQITYFLVNCHKNSGCFIVGVLPESKKLCFHGLRLHRVM